MKNEEQDELRIARAAAMWHIRLKVEGPSCHEAFLAWLLESSRHVQAYLSALKFSARLRALDPRREIDVDALISQAEDPVTPMSLDHTHDAEQTQDGAQNQPRTARTWPMVAVVVLMVLGSLLLVAPITRSTQMYATAVGEQRQIKLEDGSLIYLNTNSQVHVRYTSARRESQLLKGEALFSVERDADRPFRVSTGTAVVRALGTEFDVYRQPARTLIEVVHGEVNVLPPGKQGSGLAQEVSSAPDVPNPMIPMPTHLTTGERASVDSEGLIHRDSRNVQLAQDWQQRRLVFDGATLAEVAAEFNRYNQAQIIVEGRELGAWPIGGIFSADHPQALFRFLSAKDKRVVVDTQSDQFVIRFRSQDGS